MIYPHRGYLLVEIVKRGLKGGLEMPDSMKEEPTFGKVLDVGAPDLLEGGVVCEPPAFRVGTDADGNGGKQHKIHRGDLILFKRHTQQDVPGYEEPKQAFVHFTNVLGIEIKEEK